MTSILALVNWKACIGKYASDHSLYKYKERPTPNDYIGQHNILAFELSYDRDSKTTSLQHDKKDRDGIAVEFSNTSQPSQGSKVHTTTGWYFSQQDLSNYDWCNLKPGIETEVERNLEKKERFRWIRESEGHLYGINRLWVIRGYFIGPDENNAPPCITVLCAYEEVARFLVDRIHDKLHLHEGWGATRLPGVKVLKLASGSGSNDHPGNSDQDFTDDEADQNLIRIDIESLDNDSMPTMTNGDLCSWGSMNHRCGVHVEIVRDSQLIARATIGGLIKVGNEVFGLTVGHLFSPSSTHGDEPISLTTDTSTIMNTWQEGLACGMEFDWALVKMPGLEEQYVDSWVDVNLVQTVSGEFRPVLVAWQEPSLYTHVVLATPGSIRCLRGVFVGSGAIVNIPESPTPYITWVCRMELPWLIQSGDSGSWVLNAETGILLGVLVAGCPELQEAYIIPAYEIIDDIKQHYPDYPAESINLPNCHPPNLRGHIDEYLDIVKTVNSLERNDKLNLSRLDSRISKWIKEIGAFTDISLSSYGLRPGKESPWKPAPSVLRYNRLKIHNSWTSGGFPDSTESESDTFESLLKTAIQQPALRCYNFLNEMFMTEKDPDRIDMLHRLWQRLMLGLSNYSRNDEDIPKAKRIAFDHILKREVELMELGALGDYSTFWTLRFENDPECHHFYEDFENPIIYHYYQIVIMRSQIQREDRRMETRHYDRGPRLPPWDRLTAHGVLDMLHKGIQGRQTRKKKKRFEVSLPETKILDLPFVSQGLDPNCRLILLAVKVTERDDRLLVIVPPPFVDSSIFTQDCSCMLDYPQHAKQIEGSNHSAWRLPFILANKDVPNEETLRLLLSTQLDIRITDFKQSRKLSLFCKQSKVYLKEYQQDVDVVIYEGQIENTSFRRKHGLTGWIMEGALKSIAEYHLSPPFSAIFGSDS